MIHVLDVGMKLLTKYSYQLISHTSMCEIGITRMLSILNLFACNVNAVVFTAVIVLLSM